MNYNAQFISVQLYLYIVKSLQELPQASYK